MPEFLGRVYGLGGAGGQVPGGGGRRHYSLLYQVRLSPLKCFIYNARWKTIQNVVTLHVLSNRYLLQLLRNFVSRQRQKCTYCPSVTEPL